MKNPFSGEKERESIPTDSPLGLATGLEELCVCMCVCLYVHTCKRGHGTSMNVYVRMNCGRK